MAEEVNATVHKQALVSLRFHCLETGESREFKWSLRVSKRFVQMGKYLRVPEV